jgi:competence protein ComEC
MRAKVQIILETCKEYGNICGFMEFISQKICNFAALTLSDMKNKPFGEAPLLRLAVCLMAGIVVGDNMGNCNWLLPAFVVMVVGAMLLWRHAVVQSASIAVCFVLLGWLLVQRQEASLRVSWPEQEVIYEAVVLSEPVEKAKTMAVDILLTESGRKLKCYFYKEGRREGVRREGDRSRTLKIGDGLRIQSRIRPNSEWRKGSFDYHRYLEVHGYTGQTFVSSWKWQKAQVSLKSLSRLERTKLYFLKLRSRLLARIMTEGADGDAVAVVAAMALGDKSALSQELREVYSVTGASHVLALSGLHLGIIYMLLTLLFGGSRFFTFSPFHFFTLTAIWSFVFLVGIPVSVVRSATMLTVYALLSLGHRDKMSVNTLAFTALLVLIVSPLSLFDIGFQMSYLSVFAILLIVPLSERLFPIGYLMTHRVIRWLWGMVAVSCAAQIGVAPLVAYYFGRLPVYFLLTNFIVIPAATLILWLSPLVFLFPSLAYLLLYIVSILNTLLTAIASIPGASIDGLHPTKLQTTMTYVVIVACYLLAFWFSRRKRDYI